jgi:hypothetical protein
MVPLSVEWTRISPSGYATQVYKVLQAALSGLEEEVLDTSVNYILH